LQGLHMQLVLEGTQLVLVQLVVLQSWAFLVWELLGVYLIKEVSELSRHLAFLRINPKRMGTQAGAVVSIVAVHQVRV